MTSRAKKQKPSSPKKAKFQPNMRDNLKKKKDKPVPTINVYSFHEPIAVEAYTYTITPTKDGFLNKFRIWLKAELEVDELTEANFVALKTRRDKDSPGNVPLKDDDDYNRMYMIRYPPQNESTKETRSEGLRVLKNFFMSKKSTTYPPADILTVDRSVDEPSVLEDFFLDDDIEEIVKASCEITELEETFFENYKTFALNIYRYKEPSNFAKDQLGFPSLN